MPSPVAAAAGAKILVSGGDLPFGFGTFFHEYRLDGVLVAVSVLDVLPTRVASVYFFYDPELRFLQLGRLSALVEIFLVQRIADFTRRHPELSTCLPARATGPLCRHWDANFYVHSCAQMSYKRDFRPSELRCPQTETWARLDDAALAQLDANPVARLAPPHVSAPDAALEQRRALGVIPRVLTQLRDGSLFPFAHLNQASRDRCAIGMEMYLKTAGRALAVRALCDPNGVANAGYSAEKRREEAAARATARATVGERCALAVTAAMLAELARAREREEARAQAQAKAQASGAGAGAGEGEGAGAGASASAGSGAGALAGAGDCPDEVRS